MSEVSNPEPLTTPLDGLHRELGGKMVPFAGYMLPVQYPSGIVKEHAAAREAAALFDVSHMGQVMLRGGGAPAMLERLTPANIEGLKPGHGRYALLTDEDGGILDDFIATRTEDGLFLVVNAGRKAEDVAHLRANLADGVTLDVLEDRALLALQGPKAAAVIANLAPEAADLDFMQSVETNLGGIPARISRLGYTGEDGFEISCPASSAAKIARTLLANEAVLPAGLGARDSLRLEAGLPLYGHDLDTTTSPIEAGLAFAVAKRRRETGGFLGEERILRELRDGPARRLVGIEIEGRAPVREGAEIQDRDGETIGRVTSGGFGPSAARPVAIGYVEAEHSAPGTPLRLALRGRTIKAEVGTLPFVPRRYHRKSA